MIIKMDQESNIISFSNAKSADIIQGTPVEKTSRKRDNKGGGEPPMDKDKYVTHEELGHAIDNVSSKIDISTEKILHRMDNHFAEMQNRAIFFYLAWISIFSGFSLE